MDKLPVTTDEQVAQFQAEYQAAFNTGSQGDLEGAKCRWVKMMCALWHGDVYSCARQL
jgi:hypothetical protein